MRSIVTMALSCIIFKIKRDTGQKSRLFIPRLHSTFPLGGRRRNISITFGAEKLEWRIHQKVKKSEMFTRFDTIHERGKRTDGHRTTA